VGFGIIDNYAIFDVTKGRKKQEETLSLSHVKLDDYLFNSIKSGYIKSLNFTTYFNLRSAISKRLYRYLDKKRYGKVKFEINLFALAYVHLGFDDETYKYASLIKQKLNPVHKELLAAGLLKNFEYQKTADGSSEKVVYFFHKKSELPKAVLGESSKEEKLLDKLVNIGITRKVAEILIKEYSLEVIEAQIDALPFRKADDPAAVLVASIQNNWNPPPKYQESMHKAEQDRIEEQHHQEEERVKVERRRKINNYISALSRDELAELMGEARKRARNETKGFRKGKEIQQYMIDAYLHIIVEEKLGI